MAAFWRRDTVFACAKKSLYQTHRYRKHQGTWTSENILRKAQGANQFPRI